MHVSFEDLKNFCKQAYLKVGVPEDEAEIVAELLARSDLRGVETHGVMRLPIYIQRLQKGYVRTVCKITNVKEKGSPTAHRLTIFRESDITHKKKCAIRLAGIEE